MDAIERITTRGYTISVELVDDNTFYEPDEFTIKKDMLLVTVTFNGETVADAEFSDDGETFYCENVLVQQAHRMKGIATAMYVKAEQIKQKVLENYWDGTDTQTVEAQLLWANPNRQFGRR